MPDFSHIYYKKEDWNYALWFEFLEDFLSPISVQKPPPLLSLSEEWVVCLVDDDDDELLLPQAAAELLLLPHADVDWFDLVLLTWCAFCAAGAGPEFCCIFADIVAAGLTGSFLICSAWIVANDTAPSSFVSFANGGEPEMMIN